MTRPGITESALTIAGTCVVPLILFPRTLDWLFSPGMGAVLLALFSLAVLAVVTALVRRATGGYYLFMAGKNAAYSRSILSLGGMNLGLVLRVFDGSHRRFPDNQALWFTGVLLCFVSVGVLLWHIPWAFRLMIASLENQDTKGKTGHH